MILLHIGGVTSDELDRVFKALGDPTRRRIIDRLRERPGQSLFEICAHAAAEHGGAISRQAITQHLDMLEKAGLVRIAWAGRTKIHTLEPGPLREAVGQWLAAHLDEGQAR